MNSTALLFLRHVLPVDGFKIAYICKQPYTDEKGKQQFRKKFNVVFDTIEQLVSTLTDEDLKGATVYHACSSFTNRDGIWNERRKKFEKRSQSNVASVRAFWLDVDAGSGKPYPNAMAAIVALGAFCKSTGLPVPTVVGSGNGVHCYWPLAHSLRPDEWTVYANGLRALCSQHGLAVDPTRTCDSASVLRTPGTHHRKAEIRQVVVGPLTGPYPIEAFGVLRNVEGDGSRATGAVRGSSSVTAALGNITSYGPTDGNRIAEQCGQIRSMRDTHGNLPEPIWYAGIGVLAFVTNGDAFCQQWSSGHEGYSERETGERVARARQLTGATTCQKFHSLNPAVCEACPLFQKINSPISLGSVRYEALGTDRANVEQAVGETASPFGLNGAQAAQAKRIVGGIELPVIPDPWAWGVNNELVMMVGTLDGDIPTLISQYPIFLRSVQAGEVRGEFSFVFRQFLPNEGWKEISIGAKILFGAQGIGELADRGATVHDHKSFLSYVRHSIEKYHAEWDLEMRYDQFGWKEDETQFLCGKRLYAPDAVEPATGSKEIETRSQWLGPSRNGSLDRWTQAANSLFAQGCEAQSVALLASFAAVLMRFHSTAEGGAVISLVSRASGTGKSTTLEAVASVWGEKKGVELQNIDTKVSKGLTLGVLGNLPIIYDEIHSKDPEVIREFILIFTNGRDKMRGTQDGQIQHTQASWQTLLVTGSNISVVDMLSAAGGSDATSFRVLEFDVELPEHVKHSIGDKLRKQLEANCGFAGDAYLRYITQPAVVDYIKKAIPHYTDEIWKRTKLKSEHRFWVRAIASICVAASIVHKLGLLEFSPDRILNWLIDRVTLVDEKEVAEKANQWAVSAVSEFLTEHVADVLVMPGAFIPGRKSPPPPLIKPMRRLVVRYERDTHRILISERVFREWMLRKEYGSKEMLNTLAKIGIVRAARRLATLGAGTDYPGGQMGCIEIDGAHEALSGFAQYIDQKVDAKVLHLYPKPRLVPDETTELPPQSPGQATALPPDE